MWFNDFDKRKIAGGGDFYLRFAFARRFSLGIMGSYDALQANQKVLFPGTPLQYDYMEAKGLSADLVAWIHFTAGSRISPYLYFGAGVYNYKRKVSNNLDYSGDPANPKKSITTLHIPAGLGFEFMFSKHVGFNIDFGARLMDDRTDNFKVGVLDWYATAKAGIIFYAGSSENDDDDGDGLTNAEEENLGLDPDNADTDADGLNDGAEVNIYKTDPKRPDSDADGLKDGEEVNTHRTDPNKPDTDGDGLSDGDEVMKHRTDALKPDTDADGLSDGDEIMKYRTDVLKPDTDSDDLKDGDEVSRNTNPLKTDTDGGSVNDGREVANGTSPLDASDDVPKPKKQIELGKAIVLEGIVFQTGKAIIEPKSEETLQLALKTLNDNSEISVEIRGYTDNVGAAVTNMRLSRRRADAVRFWLIMRGVAATRITARGFGPDNPIGDNTTSEGRAKNRRIEFFRTK